MILTPLPEKNVSYSNDIATATVGLTISGATVSAGTLPTGLSLSNTALKVTLSGTPTVLGSFSFTVTYTQSFFGTPINTVSTAYTTQVILSPIASGNKISCGDIGAFTGQTINISMGGNRFRQLADDLSGPVKLSNCYAKPTPGSVSRSIAGNTTFTVPPYQALVVEVSGAGGGGSEGFSIGLAAGGATCQNSNSGINGLNGTQSSAFGLIAYGGGGAGANTVGTNGGNNQNANLGGGSAGGAPKSGTNACGLPGSSPGSGAQGGTGGYCDTIIPISSGTVDWGTVATLTAGAGGSQVNPGTAGVVSVYWS